MNNLVNWFEIPVNDFSRATTFYETLFDVELKKCDFGEEKMAFFPEKEGQVCGMISLSKGFDPSENGIVIYFDATNKMDALIDKVTKIGGKVLTGKTKIEAEGRGWFALLLDSEGNRFGFYANPDEQTKIQ